MTKNILFPVAVILWMLAALSGIFAETAGYPADGEQFSIGIEQYGLPVDVRKSRAVIDKAPFTLVLIFRGPSGVLVNFSTEPDLYRGFLRNRPLAEIMPDPDLFMGIGEAAGNPDELMLIDQLSPHFLFYNDASGNRFSSSEVRSGFIIGRRIISNYTSYEDGFEPLPIGNLEAEDIYLSFLFSEWDNDYNRIELQKEALRISFKD